MECPRCLWNLSWKKWHDSDSKLSLIKWAAAEISAQPFKLSLLSEFTPSISLHSGRSELHPLTPQAISFLSGWLRKALIWFPSVWFLLSKVKISPVSAYFWLLSNTSKQLVFKYFVQSLSLLSAGRLTQEDLLHHCQNENFLYTYFKVFKHIAKLTPTKIVPGYILTGNRWESLIVFPFGSQNF